MKLKRHEAVTLPAYPYEYWFHLGDRAMLWKLFGLQKILDSLFDDSWVCFGLPDDLNYDYETSEQFLRV